ncbi:MAG: extracellular solute-binding protein [Lachnospiraceae bacterium]|nr:extracellular solute-binding protein [Lachnospiraceae bacterium]
MQRIWRNIIKKGIPVWCILLLFCGCGNKEQGKTSSLYVTKGEILLSEEVGNLQDIQCITGSGNIYFTAMDTRNKEAQVGCIGEQTEVFAILPGESVLSGYVSEEDRVAVLTHRIEDGQYLLHCFKEKTEEAVYSLNQVMAEIGEVNAINTMAVDENILLLVTWGASDIWVIDYTTDTLRKLPVGVPVTSLTVEESGDILAATENGMLYRIDAQDGSREEIASGIYTQTNNGSKCVFVGEEILISGQSGLYRYLPESGETELIADYVKHNILSAEYAITAENTDSGKIYKMIAVNPQKESLEIYLLSMTEIPGTYMSAWGIQAESGSTIVSEEDKQVIIAELPQTLQMQEAVIAFNQNSDKYRIEVPGWEDAEYYGLRRDTELMTGGGADILMVAGSTHFSDYADRGILEDLKPYIEADLDEDAYLENILYAFEKEGKVYAIETGVSVTLLAGSKEILGEREGWTFEELKEIMEANPQITSYRNTEPMNILRDCWLIGGGIEPDDYDTLRECLLFAKEYGNLLGAGEEAVPGENVIVVHLQMNTPLSLANWEAKYGNELCLIGYPNVDRQGIRAGDEGLSINAASENKEGAWEFLKFLLSEEYQRGLQYKFPILKSAYEEMLCKYGQPENYEVYVPELGETVEVTNGYLLPHGGYIDYMTEEQLETVDELIEKCTADRWGTDYGSWNIIYEEAPSYFSGDKTLDEVMVIIENRVELHLNEK